MGLEKGPGQAMEGEGRPSAVGLVRFHVRKQPHQRPAQGGGLPPQGQVDHPRLPLIQYGAQEDGFSLGHGGEGNPVPAVQVFEGSVGEVEEVGSYQADKRRKCFS